jgi:hypothetical protein
MPTALLLNTLAMPVQVMPIKLLIIIVRGTRVKAMLHAAIFLATCNAILLLRDVKLPNTSLHYTPLMFSQHIENSSQISLINISQE